MISSERAASTSLSIRVLAIAALLAIFAVLPSAASALPAPTLFAATGGSGDSSKVASPSPLFSINPSNGAVLASIGNTGYALTGLAQDPTTGILYGVSNNKSPIAPRVLVTIDPATGAATQVGPLGLIIADISFDSQGRLFGWSESKDTLASIDKATGAATQIGKNELSTYGSGLSFDLNDTLWFFGLGEFEPFFTVDTATGVATERGKLVPLDDDEKPISAVAYDCARTTLYGVLSAEGEGDYNLLNINTGSGLLANLGTTLKFADGLEWYCPLAFEFPASGKTVTGGKAQTLTLPVVRGPRIKGAASVSFATVAGTAKAGQDFVAASGPLAFANNVSEGSVAIKLKANPKAGADRKFQVLLSTPSAGGTVGAPFTVTIKAPKPGKATIKGPKRTSAERPLFRLSSKQLPARFRCKLDKGKFKGCGKAGKKPKKFKPPALAPGTHKLTVQIVNGAGRKSKPAKLTFTVLPG